MWCLSAHVNSTRTASCPWWCPSYVMYFYVYGKWNPTPFGAIFPFLRCFMASFTCLHSFSTWEVRFHSLIWLFCTIKSCILKALHSLRVRERKQGKFRMSLLSIYFASSSSLSLGGLGNKHTSCLSVLQSWQVEAYLNSQNRCSFLSPFESPPLSATRYHVNVMYRRNCHGYGY